jgi:hypothetical protein
MAQRKPCDQCPWLQKKPDEMVKRLTDAARPALERGDWFCCHVRLDECDGARLLQQKMGVHKEQQEAIL